MRPRRTIFIGVGGFGKEAIEKVEELLIEELGGIPPFVGFIRIDSDLTTTPHVLLGRHEITDALNNLRAYGIDKLPDTINVALVNRTHKGALLTRPIGRIGYITKIRNVESALRGAHREMEERIKKEGSNVTEKTQVVIVASPFAGTGGPVMTELPSLVSEILKRCRIVVLTSFVFASAGSEIALDQYSKARKNAEETRKELIALEKKEKPQAFFPHLKDGVFRYPGELNIPAVIPNYIFNIIKESSSIDALKNDLAIFAKDFILYGAPLDLEHTEDTVYAVEERNVISAIPRSYLFPFDKVRRVYIDEGFKEQMVNSIKEQEESYAISEEAKLRKFFGG